MGALTREDARVAAGRGRTSWPGTSGSSRSTERRAAGEGAREARHRHGPAGREGRREARGASPSDDARAGRRDDALRDGGRARRRPFPAQLERFAPFVEARAARTCRPRREQRGDLPRHGRSLRHGAVRHRRLRARPFHEGPAERGLEPALRWVVRGRGQALRAGRERGLRAALAAPRPTWVGTLPIGYGDGWRRGLTNNADVLVGGRRYPLVGTVSMDNITIDLGPETDVAPGDRAVLIGEDAASASSARTSRGGSTRSTTRSPAGCRRASGAPRHP